MLPASLASSCNIEDADFGVGAVGNFENIAEVAQLVEHSPEEGRVTGSTPVLGTTGVLVVY